MNNLLNNQSCLRQDKLLNNQYPIMKENPRAKPRQNGEMGFFKTT
jgi:hypothetical protein